MSQSKRRYFALFTTLVYLTATLYPPDVFAALIAPGPLRPTPVAPGQPPPRQDLVFDAENRLVQVTTAQEATVGVTFQPGWNFFSLPVIPAEAEIAALFPDFAQRFEQIARVAADGSFEHYVGQAQFDQFDELEYGWGYQVYCTASQAVTLSFTGKLPSQRLSKSLATGWHLLPALVVDSPKPPSWLTQGLSADAVLKVAPGTGLTAPATEIAAGQAYWVHLTQAGVFSPALPRDPTTSFVYDGDGGRVQQATAAGTTLYLGELHEQAPEGTVTKHVFAGSQRVASLVIPPAGSASLRFSHGDHLGSTHLVTDSTGQVIEVSENTPFGTLYLHQGSAQSPHQFTGQRLDPSTGLHFYQARYYDSHLGRFISPDPFIQAASDPQTLNRYAYVRNNPVKYTDPSGNFVFLAALAFIGYSAAVAGTIGAVLSVGTGLISGNIHNVGDFLRAAGVGFAAGAAAGATGAMGALILGPAMTGSFLGSIAIGAGSGAIGGGVGSVLNGGSFGQGAGWGALTGGALAGAGHQIGPTIARTQIGQALGRLTSPITGRLANLYNQALSPRTTGIDGVLTRIQHKLHYGYNSKIAYRALTAHDADRLNAGLGLEAKNPNGRWTLADHIAKGSRSTAWANDPWIATTSDINVARAFDSGNGIAIIDLGKVPSAKANAWEIYPRVGGREGIPYHYSVWQQEVSVYREIPYEAIVGGVE